MIQTSRGFILIFCGLLFGGCGSSPAVRYFALETIGIEHQRDAADAPVLAVGPLRVPDYLRRSQMVRRGPGSEIIVDDFNRWAEPLDEAILRTVAINVDGLIDSGVVVAFPSGTVLDINYRVFGRIDRFDTDRNGNTILDVQWGIGDGNGNVVAATRRSRYQSQVNQSDDSAAMAEAMSDTIGQFSRDVATEFGLLLR